MGINNRVAYIKGHHHDVFTSVGMERSYSKHVELPCVCILLLILIILTMVYMFVKSHETSYTVYDSILYNCTLYELPQSNSSHGNVIHMNVTHRE